jgi:tryptophanyl-tRNA synthetase
MRENTRDVALDYLALGLDPERAVFFRQSDVPEVCELTWLLSSVTGMGLLERAVSYKDKIARGIQPRVGLFTYPVLMAADILIYDSDIVPVGADQVQHIEMTRDMAGYFNATYGEVFKLPEPRIEEATAKVPGTDGQKMSKSYGNTIGIFDEGKTLKQRVMGIVTDSTPVEAAKDPDESTIYQLYTLVGSQSEAADMAERFRAGGYG